ncbi:MAG TPA: GNAT family N-acetyltransferase [Longimicrobium sp.]|jgi:GNAT superfamily N-acetyltransferase
MQPPVQVRGLAADDIEPIVSAFAAAGWPKPRQQYERYLGEQAAERRVVLVAWCGGEVCGYATVVWEPKYPPFREERIPEIQDLNVLPRFRRRGIATLLLDEAERLAGARSPVVGIGVGVYADYGAAQRLYVRRGYVPDGLGVSYLDRIIQGGETVVADDNLVLHLRKDLPA